MDTALRAELAVRGIRARAPVRRRGGAGPSDDGHLLVDSRQSALPLVASSPFTVADGQLLRDGTPVGVSVAARGSPALL